jgi:crotonobetainyl-CoA:carnitine CoA-transferase CaiB-like acyl-CoA transferase
LSSREFWAQVEHPELGEAITYPGPFLRASLTPLGIKRRAPLVGEHNKEVYRDLLGFSDADLILLSQAGVI